MHQLGKAYNNLVPVLCQAGTVDKGTENWYQVNRVHSKSMYSGKLVPGSKLVINYP